MSAATALASYSKSSTATASPREVVRMAYDRVLTSCSRAEVAERDQPTNWVQTFHDEMVRAQAILRELSTVLAVGHPDTSVSKLSRDLDELYRFCIEEMIDANIDKDPEPLDGVRMVIDGLRDAWLRQAS